MDHTPGSTMFETTKPATTGANRSTSAGNDHFKCSYIDRSFLFGCERDCSLVLHPRAERSFHFFDFFQPRCYWLCSTWAYSSHRCFFFVHFLSWSAMWVIPLFLLLRKYYIFSWFFQNIWLSQASLQYWSFPFACTIFLFWIKMLKHSWDVEWVCFYVEKFLSAKE